MSGTAHIDSPCGQQWHVRYRVIGMREDGPFWTYVYDDEAVALQRLADLRAEKGLSDVSLWVRDVSPWRQA